MRFTKRLLILFAALAAMLTMLLALGGCEKKEPDGGKHVPPVITTKYLISFYEEDGTTLIETREFTHGDTLTTPVRNKEGHSSIWTYYNLEGEEIYMGYTAIDNAKAVVSYERFDYQVVINDISTEERIYEAYIFHGDSIVFSEIPDLEYMFSDANHKPGFIFKGLVTEDSEDYIDKITVTSSVVIYAVYEPIPHTIVFRADDGKDTMLYGPSTAIYGSTVTMPAAPEKEGFVFDGWYVKEGFSNIRVGEKGSTYTISNVTEENIETVFWAVYKPAENKG